MVYSAEKLFLPKKASQGIEGSNIIPKKVKFMLEEEFVLWR